MVLTWLPHQPSPPPLQLRLRHAGGFALAPRASPGTCPSVFWAEPSLCPPQAFYYPEEAGLAFGGPGSSRFLRLEVHYHNPLVITGRTSERAALLTCPPPALGSPWTRCVPGGSRAGRAQPASSPPSRACLSPDPLWPVALSASSLPVSCGCGGLLKAHTHTGGAQRLTPTPTNTSCCRPGTAPGTTWERQLEVSCVPILQMRKLRPG